MFVIRLDRRFTCNVSFFRNGLELSLFYFAILLIFLPLGGPIERLIYDTYIYLSEEFEVKNTLYFYFRQELVGILGFIILFIYINIEGIKNVCPDI